MRLHECGSTFMNDDKPAVAPPDASAGKPAAPASMAKPAGKRRRWLLPLAGLAAVGIVCLGIPFISRAFNTVSTDDAYVNSYVTFVAPRVAGQVARVLVEDNNRVKTGDVLVELDPEP